MALNQISISCPITLNVFFHIEKKWNEGVGYRPLVVLAAAVAAAVSPIFLLADAVRGVYRSCIQKIPSADYHYFFSTPIFDSYKEQLQGVIESELIQHPELASLDLVQWLRAPIQDKKTFYQNFVSRLRDLVNQKAVLKDEVSAFVERLCYWVYTGPDLMPPMTDWMKGLMTSEEKKQFANCTSDKVLLDLYRQWGSEPRFQGEIFQDYRSYDPRYLGDTPSRLFCIENTQIIRTPAIVRDGDRSLLGHLSSAAVVEEFLGFLEHQKKEGKSHLYINLMAPQGSERIRNQALEDLEKMESEHFHLVTLSKDSPFYHQAGPLAFQNDAEVFKRGFIDAMFNDRSSFHWPISWDLSDIQQDCLNAVNEVHEKYFLSAPLLDLAQRHAFIELTYTEIVTKILLKKRPSTCNISCRSCVDRGPVGLSLLYARNKPLDSSQAKETLATMTLAPAMIAQSRLMLSHRMSRLLPALSHLCIKGLRRPRTV